MKFVLVLTILSVFSDLNLNIVTNKTFDTLEECLLSSLDDCLDRDFVRCNEGNPLLWD